VFRPVAVADSAAGTPAPLPSIDYGTPASPVQIGDFQEQDRSFEPRAEPDQPVRAESLLKATPKPKPVPASGGSGGGGGGSGHSVRGTASWYCKAGVSVCHNAYPGGLYAAAGPALRVGNWRGRTVTVCGSGSCVNVKLIDWCACGSGRVIDLYSDAFSRLAPLSSGTLSVRVTW
jgi:rare lipoprotein A (peptidoglycan hydrolase)